MFIGEALFRIKGFIINKRGIKKMRKIGTIFVISLLLVGFAFAGGIVHNTNHSADFIRLMNRNASTDVDAVYFNPAGLTYLNDGLHFYLSSQTIYQTRTITSDVPTLVSDTFEGTTFAPVFPNFYFAYKKGDLAIGAGFVPIGGGGSAIFDDGLPSFAVPASLLPAGLTASGIPTSNYDFDVAFDGSSIYLGGQAVVSYKVNDMISVAAGARYFAATNTYTGHLTDIMIDPTVPGLADGSMVSAPEFFTTMAGALTAGAAQALGGAALAQGAADGLQPFIDGGAGGFTFDQLIGAQMVDQATVDGIGAGVVALGGTFDSSTDTPAGIQAFFSGTAAYLTGYSAELTANAGAMTYNAAATQDIEVDAEQTGSGFAPIFGLYLTPMEGFAIALRYEGKAAMTLTNETKVDGSGLFPDGAEIGADMPAMMSVGLALKATPSLRIVADMNYYFNQGVDWSGKEDYLKDGMEAGVGFDFALNESLQLSAGFLRTLNTGALPRYHTDLSHTISSSTIGLGGRYSINSNLYISFGVSNSFYDGLNKSGVDYRGLWTGNETYDKSTIDFAIGIGYSR
jgi:long-subunit fatty acid transport protein